MTNLLVPVGTQRSDGLELTLSVQLAGDWQVWSGKSFLDTEVVSSPALASSDNVGNRVPVQGKRATLTPGHCGNLWVPKSFKSSVRTGLGVVAVSERFANPGDRVKLPGFATADAMVGYRLGAVDLPLHANNLLDGDYIVSGHRSTPNLNMQGRRWGRG